MKCLRRLRIKATYFDSAHRTCGFQLRYNPVMSDVTQMLSAIERGDASAAEQLLPFLYQELHKLAAAKLSKEKPGQTIPPTVPVHEAYVRLVDGDAAQQRNPGRSCDKGHSLRMPPCQHPT